MELQALAEARRFLEPYCAHCTGSTIEVYWYFRTEGYDEIQARKPFL